MKRKLNWEKTKELYEKGWSINQISNTFSVNPSTVWNALKKMNVVRRTIKLSEKLDVTDDLIIEAVKDMVSYSSVLKSLNIKYTRHRVNWLKKKIKKLNLDITHWKGIGLKRTPKPIEYYLKENTEYTGSTSNLKKRLLKEKILQNKCSNCGIKEWLEKPISIQLDHINGDVKDNRLENLRMLCPNCHSQTDTYGGKRFKKPQNKCLDCNKNINHRARRCTKCSALNREQLKRRIKHN